MKKAPITKSNESLNKHLYYIKLAAQPLFKAFAGVLVLYGLAQLLEMGGLV